MRCTKPFENAERFFFLSNLCNLCKSRNAIPGSQIARNINAKKINDSLSCQFRVTSTCTFALSKSLIPGPNLTSSCHLKYTWLQNSSICISSHFFSWKPSGEYLLSWHMLMNNCFQVLHTLLDPIFTLR